MIRTTLRASIPALLVTALSLSTATADDTAGRSGTFSGLSGHRTSGSVSVVEGADGHEIRLGADFSLDGAPDPKVALGKGGEFDPATLIEPLRSNSGAQVYEIPAAIDASDYDEVYIWCERYSVGLGVAPLS